MSTKMSSFSPLLLKFIKLFQLFGIISLSLSSNPCVRWRMERLLWLWSLFLFMCFNVTVLYTFTCNKEFFFLGDFFGYFNDVLKLSTAHISIMAIYLECLLQHRRIQRFWTLYAWLRTSRMLCDENAQNWRLHCRFLGIFYLSTAINIVCGLIFYVLQEFNPHLLIFYCTFTPYIYVVHFRNMQIILHMEIIRQELVILQQDLRLLADYTRFARRVVPFSGFEEFLRRKLLYKQMIYSSIYEMFESFQGAFGFSIVTVLLMTSMRILVDSYFMFVCIYKDVARDAEDLQILPALIEIPAFLLTARNCMNVVKHITFELHNIVSQVSAESTSLSVQLQNFSLQILHQQIRIDGVGITTMDGYMLTRAVGAVIAYMIFFIQFMPNFRNF